MAFWSPASSAEQELPSAHEKRPGVTTGPISKVIKRRWKSEDSSLLQRHECTILVDGLQCAAAELKANELAELRNPDALGLKIWRDRALHHFRDVTTDTTFFLGQTRTVNFSARADAGSSDAANTGHNRKFRGCGTRRMALETDPSRRILTNPDQFFRAGSFGACWSTSRCP